MNKQVKQVCAIRCSVCGMFCKTVDSSTSCGGYLDTEPPEPKYYCAMCVEKEKQFYIKQRWLPCHWRPARWEFEVAKQIDFIRIFLPGCAWAIWHDAKYSIPCGYKEENERTNTSISNP